MSDINEIKKETEEIQSYRAMFGHTGFEDSGNLIKNIFSLITTIESQKEEIESLNNIHKGYAHQSKVIEIGLNSQIESLKAITELAVKENERLKKIQQMVIFHEDFQALTPMKKYALAVEMMGDSFWDDSSEIKRLSHE